MKKLLLILLCLPILTLAQKTYVPDDNFETFLESNGMGDGLINDSVLTTIISSVSTLNVSSFSIQDMTGIQDFINLQVLKCEYNQITVLDLSQNTALTELVCRNNQLTSLDLSYNTALTVLECSNNQLTSLDVSNNTALTYLECSFNLLISLDLNGATSIIYLNCNDNQLTSLDVSGATALTVLDCNDNQLTSLDVSQNTALTSLACYNNQLTSLDVSNNTALEYFNCHSNQLTYLDARNGNNTNISFFYALNNYNLYCISVSNLAWANVHWNNWINGQTSFSLNCSTAFGCMVSAACNYDSIATIDTGICNYNSIHIDTVISCNLYNWFGNAYTVSGIYDTILFSINSCDSIATLNLTITNSDSSFNNITSCDAYQWNGLNLTNSGTYDTIFVNNFGCDSIVNLNLTILNSTTNSTNISVCDEYAWQGNIYYNSGVYIDTITNSFGCDSIMSLNLIINNSPNVVITQNNNMLEAQSFGGASPYGFIWNTGDTTMNIIPQVSGNYWVLSIDANGCVSDTSHFAVFIIANQIEETSSVKNLSKIVNSLGQPLKPVNNMPLFYIYEDGTVEKRIVIE